MKRGPAPGAVPAADHLANALAAWGEDHPDWAQVRALATAAEMLGCDGAGERIGYSGTVVSQVIRRRYGTDGRAGNIARVWDAVRVHLMAETVECPGLDMEIAVERCRREQRKKFSASSPIAMRLHAACQTCPHKERKT